MNFSDGMKGMCETLTQSRSDREKAMRELHSAHSRNRMERKSTIKRLFGDVHVLVQHFHTGRGKMSKELRQMLEGYFEGIQKNVRGFLREFRTQHKAMSGRQQAELKAFRTSLGKDVKALMGQLRERIEEIAGQSQAVRKEARGMIREYRADFKKAHGYWTEFATGMKKLRTVATASKKAGSSSLQARVMSSLKGSPEGMTMKELSYAMGMSERPLKRVLMGLRRKKEISKKKNIFRAA